MDDVHLPSLLVTSAHSTFRLRVCAAAWSSECGGAAKRYGTERDGLLLLSAVGPDTATKAVRAILYSVDLEAEFALETDDGTERLARARFDDKQVSYQAAVAKLAPGAVHLTALAKLPGLMPNMSDDHLWAELTGPRYTTPLLRSWVGLIKKSLLESGGIIMAEGHNSQAGMLTATQADLDEIVSRGVREGSLTMLA